MLNVFICEDEQNILNSIRTIIDTYCPGAQVCSYAQSVQDAVQKIPKSSPDLLLLDVNFPDGTGFDILNSLKTINFKLIFITAHEEYAVKAIKLSASDFLLKPLNPKELLAAIERIKNEQTLSDLSDINLKTLLSNNQINDVKKRKIVLKTQEHIHVVEIADIIRCESDSSYTTFFLHNKNKILVSKNLKEFDELLNDYGFIRTHKSHLVNSDHITLFDRNLGYLILSDENRVPVSVRKRDFVIKSLDLM